MQVALILAIFGGACRDKSDPTDIRPQAAIPPGAPAPHDSALVDAINRSVNKPTTQHECVLVDVADGNTQEESQVALPVRHLLSALATERGLSSTETVEYVKRAPRARFVFKDPAILRQLLLPFSYSDEELDATRTLLRGLSAEAAIEEQNRLDSTLNVLSVKKYGRPYGFLWPVLHVLLARGIPCGASCKPGLAYVVNTKQ